MTVTTATATDALSAARSAESAWRLATLAAAYAAALGSARARHIAQLEADQCWLELVAAVEGAGVGSPGQAREAGLSVWVDAVLGVGVQVEGGSER